MYLGLSIDPEAPPDLSCLDRLSPGAFVIVKRLIGISFADLRRPYDQRQRIGAARRRGRRPLARGGRH